MTTINFEQFKAKKEMKERALQRAKAYNVDINTMLSEMEAIAATETITTKVITVEEAMAALRGTVITPEQLGLSTPDLSADVQVIEWDDNIPY